jgi:hypothetical protein
LFSLGLPLRPEGTNAASSLGLPPALILLNRSGVFADVLAGLQQMW